MCWRSASSGKIPMIWIDSLPPSSVRSSMPGKIVVVPAGEMLKFLDSCGFDPVMIRYCCCCNSGGLQDIHDLLIRNALVLVIERRWSVEMEVPLSPHRSTRPSDWIGTSRKRLINAHLIGRLPEISKAHRGGPPTWFYYTDNTRIANTSAAHLSESSSVRRGLGTISRLATVRLLACAKSLLFGADQRVGDYTEAGRRIVSCLLGWQKRGWAEAAARHSAQCE